MGKRGADSVPGKGPPLPPGRVARVAPRIVPPPVRSQAGSSVAQRGQRNPQVVAPRAKARPTQANVLGPTGPSQPAVEPPEYLLPGSDGSAAAGDQPEEDADPDTVQQDVAPSSPDEDATPASSRPLLLSRIQLQREFVRLRSFVRSTGVQIARDRRNMNHHLEFETDRVLMDNAQLRAENDNLRSLVASLSDRIDQIEDHLGFVVRTPTEDV